MAEFRLETERLILREWREADRAPFHAMSNDVRVMETLGPLMSRVQSNALIDRVQGRQAQHGHTFWAIEERESAAFLGWCGIVLALEALPISGLPEIGWRLTYDGWGKGFAREAAQRSLAYGFDQLGLERIWAITSVGNTRSWRLMERLGMIRDPKGDFDHPNVADGSPLKPHITYSIGSDQWLKTL